MNSPKSSRMIVFTALLSFLFTSFYCTKHDALASEQGKSSLLQFPSAGKQNKNITVPFVTLRNRTGSSDPSDFYGGERGELEAGFCSVGFSPIWGLDGISQTLPFYIPDENIQLDKLQSVTLKKLERAYRSAVNEGKGDLTLYIHGYNIDFAKSCRRSALLKRALGLEEGLLLFSWPADGNMLKYTWDESDVLWSVPHIAAFLEQLVQVTGDGHVNIVAHSLGARGMVQALVRLAYRNNDRIMLNELVLIAPDIDSALFEQDLGYLKKICKRITVYVSDNDKALKLSEEVHGYPRLGQAGLHLSLYQGVETIDISTISLRRFSGHLYHIFNPEVIRDLTELLITGKAASQRSHLKASKQEKLQYWILQPEEN